MADDLPQRRKHEKTGALRKRGKKVGAAEAATDKSERERMHGPWRTMWEKETGKKYGIATAGEYNSWLAKKREERRRKKEKGMTAGKQSKALKPGTKP